MKFLKPKIVISKCLEFEACRYDGQIINNRYIDRLKSFIDFIPVCPEVEINMGVPRSPIKIIREEDKTYLYQTDTERDFSSKMNNFSEKYLSKITEVDGFILKSRSPSCGIKSAKIYAKSSPAPLGKDSGFFAAHVIKKFPNHPKEEEKRLNNPFIREHFYTSIFTIADFREVNDFDTLYKYHSKHKYLFLSFNQILLRKMGNIAANRDGKSIETVINEYYNQLLTLISNRPKPSSNINTQMHVMGYFKKHITSKEKKHFLSSLELYRDKKIPISTVNSILSSWIHRFENDYLMKQSFFNPFPVELIEKKVSRFE